MHATTALIGTGYSLITFDVIIILLVAVLIVLLTLGLLTTELEPEQDFISTPRINKPGITATLCAGVYRIIYLLIGPLTLGMAANFEWRDLTKQSETATSMDSLHRWSMMMAAMVSLAVSILYVLFIEVNIPSASVLSGQSKLHALSMYMTLPLAAVVGHPFISTIPSLLCIMANYKKHPYLNIVLWL